MATAKNLTEFPNGKRSGLLNRLEWESEIDETDLEELVRQIKEGFTSGRLDSDNKHISWELKTEVWED